MKTIIIVGGSKGIGLALTTLLSSTHKVVVISRTKPEIQSNNITYYSCNILTDSLPEIPIADGLVYCPGSINLKPIIRLSLDEFREDLEINVIGAVKTIQHYLPVLQKGNNPAILLFSTVATALGMPFHASVATAKSAVEGLTKSLAAEFSPTIRVNAIAPTITNTTLASKILRNEKAIENIKNRHPLKNILQPQEVAVMANYLLSDDAKAISGQIFKIDNGMVHIKP